MKPASRNTLAITAGIGVALSCGAVLGVNRAQGQQQPAQGGQRGGFAPGQGPASGQRGGQGSAGYRITQGKITAGDAAAGTITISTTVGTTQVLTVSADTIIQVQQTITAKDLAIGDEVKVQGIPTGISATSITAGSPPTFLAGGRARGPGAAGAAGGNGLPENPQTGTAMATGKVVSTSPLTMSIGENMDIVLRLGHDARVTRYATIPFGNLKVGDSLIAAGMVAQDGTFTVGSIGINMNIASSGAFTPGGARRPGGQPGAGGQPGPGPGQ